MEKMEILEIDFKQKISNKYFCNICDYKTNRKGNFNTHLLSAKHTKEINGKKK